MPSPHILVTGASRGIGAAILTAFDGKATIVGHASSARDGLIAADLDTPSASADLWACALDRLDGRIDILVNNAGVFEAAPIDLDDAAWLAAWERTMRINLTASAELCRLAVRHFVERAGGG